MLSRPQGLVSVEVMEDQAALADLPVVAIPWEAMLRAREVALEMNLHNIPTLEMRLQSVSREVSNPLRSREAMAPDRHNTVLDLVLVLDLETRRNIQATECHQDNDPQVLVALALARLRLRAVALVETQGPFLPLQVAPELRLACMVVLASIQQLAMVDHMARLPGLLAQTTAQPQTHDRFLHGFLSTSLQARRGQLRHQEG